MDDRDTNAADGDLCFVLMLRSKKGERMARTAIEGLRTFGGRLRRSPVWVFVLEADRVSQVLPGVDNVRRLPLAVEPGWPPYPFLEKVYACARAEELAGAEIRSLVWLSPDCLVVNPPVLFNLGASHDTAEADAAFRPVHHRNVGSRAHERLDAFWQGIYRHLGIDAMPHTVESFVDGETLRPYFNTHCFALNPSKGIAHAWRAHFRALVDNHAFQAGPCADARHRIFLHQAILSALVAKELPWDRVRLLPPEYNYPLNLLDEMEPALRTSSLNSLVSVVYEDTFPLSKISIEEPLRSWVMARFPLGVS